MGKIFPRITNLKESPSFFDKTLKLIEKSFQYEQQNSFQIDFAPLITESNHQNCFILVDEHENVLAHIGAKDKTLTLQGSDFPITMLGGIAVDENHRGEGHFQTLLTDVMAEKRSETTLFLLWSDMEKLYNKFGFYLCGTQFECAKKREESHFIKTKYFELAPIEKEDIQKLYAESFAKTYLTLNRSQEDWKLIEKISSADLYIKKHNGRITDYYFMNKGQDLPHIIYEYGTKGEMRNHIEALSLFGKVWMGSPLIETDQLQYQFFMCPGDLRLFTEFIRHLTNGLFLIRNINLMKQEVFFDFNQETLVLSTEEFLRGVFGPGSFEELESPTLYISGLDSI